MSLYTLLNVLLSLANQVFNIWPLHTVCWEYLLTLSKFPGSYDLVTLKDARDTSFTTRIDYVMPVANGKKTFLTLPSGNGVRKTIMEVRDAKIAAEEEDL